VKGVLEGTMAKERDKGAKAAPTEELVEKPREPMFSPTGMIVFIGTVVLVAVIVFIGAYAIISTSTPNGGEPGPAGQGSASGRRLTDTEFLPLEGITAQVRQHGGQTRRVRFNVNIVFDGSPAERLRALELIRQGNRLSYVTQLAEEVIRTFDYEQIIEPEFPNVYERQFRERFNAENSDMKIHMARPFKWDFN
jgi:hypothetical protein